MRKLLGENETERVSVQVRGIFSTSPLQYCYLPLHLGLPRTTHGVALYKSALAGLCFKTLSPPQPSSPCTQTNTPHDHAGTTHIHYHITHITITQAQHTSITTAHTSLSHQHNTHSLPHTPTAAFDFVFNHDHGGIVSERFPEKFPHLWRRSGVCLCVCVCVCVLPPL